MLPSMTFDFPDRDERITANRLPPSRMKDSKGNVRKRRALQQGRRRRAEISDPGIESRQRPVAQVSSNLEEHESGRIIEGKPSEGSSSSETAESRGEEYFEETPHTDVDGGSKDSESEESSQVDIDDGDENSVSEEVSEDPSQSTLDEDSDTEEEDEEATESDIVEGSSGSGLDGGDPTASAGGDPDEALEDETAQRYPPDAFMDRQPDPESPAIQSLNPRLGPASDPQEFVRGGYRGAAARLNVVPSLQADAGGEFLSPPASLTSMYYPDATQDNLPVPDGPHDHAEPHGDSSPLTYPVGPLPQDILNEESLTLRSLRRSPISPEQEFLHGATPVQSLTARLSHRPYPPMTLSDSSAYARAKAEAEAAAYGSYDDYASAAAKAAAEAEAYGYGTYDAYLASPGLSSDLENSLENLRKRSAYNPLALENGLQPLHDGSSMQSLSSRCGHHPYPPTPRPYPSAWAKAKAEAQAQAGSSGYGPFGSWGGASASAKAQAEAEAYYRNRYRSRSALLAALQAHPSAASVTSRDSITSAKDAPGEPLTKGRLSMREKQQQDSQREPSGSYLKTQKRSGTRDPSKRSRAKAPIPRSSKGKSSKGKQKSKKKGQSDQIGGTQEPTETTALSSTPKTEAETFDGKLGSKSEPDVEKPSNEEEKGRTDDELSEDEEQAAKIIANAIREAIQEEYGEDTSIDEILKSKKKVLEEHLKALRDERSDSKGKPKRKSPSNITEGAEFDAFDDETKELIETLAEVLREGLKEEMKNKPPSDPTAKENRTGDEEESAGKAGDGKSGNSLKSTPEPSGKGPSSRFTESRDEREENGVDETDTDSENEDLLFDIELEDASQSPETVSENEKGYEEPRKDGDQNSQSETTEKPGSSSEPDRKSPSEQKRRDRAPDPKKNAVPPTSSEHYVGTQSGMEVSTEPSVRGDLLEGETEKKEKQGKEKKSKNKKPKAETEPRKKSPSAPVSRSRRSKEPTGEFESDESESEEIEMDLVPNKPKERIPFDQASARPGQAGRLADLPGPGPLAQLAQKPIPGALSSQIPGSRPSKLVRTPQDYRAKPPRRKEALSSRGEQSSEDSSQSEEQPQYLSGAKGSKSRSDDSVGHMALKTPDDKRARFQSEFDSLKDKIANKKSSSEPSKQKSRTRMKFKGSSGKIHPGLTTRPAAEGERGALSKIKDFDRGTPHTSTQSDEKSPRLMSEIHELGNKLHYRSTTPESAVSSPGAPSGQQEGGNGTVRNTTSPASVESTPGVISKIQNLKKGFLDKSSTAATASDPLTKIKGLGEGFVGRTTPSALQEGVSNAGSRIRAISNNIKDKLTYQAPNNSNELEDSSERDDPSPTRPSLAPDSLFALKNSEELKAPAPNGEKDPLNGIGGEGLRKAIGEKKPSRKKSDSPKSASKRKSAKKKSKKPLLSSESSRKKNRRTSRKPFPNEETDRRSSPPDGRNITQSDVSRSTPGMTMTVSKSPKDDSRAELKRKFTGADATGAGKLRTQKPDKKEPDTEEGDSILSIFKNLFSSKKEASKS
ncbi:treacle protein-like [Galendromus occidentalis]|uniref:Treacle protein-like n=1 Tax=Galendromus occidentalis TaxID=34638 RepID=A0AAJ7L7V0_9ACAR|nr:treacle protein-like [Galendromus occidentalis]